MIYCEILQDDWYCIAREPKNTLWSGMITWKQAASMTAFIDEFGFDMTLSSCGKAEHEETIYNIFDIKIAVLMNARANWREGLEYSLLEPGYDDMGKYLEELLRINKIIK